MKNTKMLVCYLLAAIMLVCIGLLGACKDDEIVPESITITGKPQETIIDFEKDGTLQLDAVIEPEGVKNAVLEWRSSNTDVANIDDNGLVSFAAPGHTVISVSIKDTEISDMFTLSLRGQISGISITNKPDSQTERYFGETVVVNYEVTPSFVGAYNIVWTSSDEQIAVVEEGENMSAVVTMRAKKGTATISATVEGTQISDSFDIKGGGERSYFIDFDQQTIDYTVNGDNATAAMVSIVEQDLPTNGSGKAIKFDSGTTNVKYAGISFTFPEIFKEGALYHVSYDIRILSTSKGDSNVILYTQHRSHEDNLFSFTVTGTGSYHVEGSFYGVGTDKLLIFYGIEELQVSFTVDNLSVEREVIDGVTILGKQDTIEFSEKTLILTPSNTYGYEIVWTSSNEAVATIEDGIVTLKDAGSTTITLSVPSLGLSDSFILEVLNTTGWYPLEYDITGYEDAFIELRNGDVFLKLGYELTYNGIGEADEQKLSWQIDESIGIEKAQIDSSGNLTFKQAGFEQDEEQDITVNLIYNDEGQDYVVASVTFNVKFTAYEPLVFTLKDSSDKTYSATELYSIDVKDGEVVIDFEYAYTGDNFQSEKVAFEIDADEQTAEMTSDGVVTFKASSFKLVKLALLYDGVEQTSATFAVYDSSNQSLGKILSDGQSTVTQALAEDAPNSLLTEAKKVNIKAGSDAWPAMRIWLQDGQKFISNTSYLILVDIKMLEDGINSAEDAKRFLFFGGVSGGHVLPLPLLGQTKTISAVITIGGEDRDYITAFRNNCDLTFGINNVRIIKLDGPATTLSSTLNGEQNDITELTCNGDNKGLAKYGDSVVFANGLIGWPALNGVLSGLEEGKTYTISYDFTMLNNSVANGQIFFRFGMDEKYAIFNAFEKQTVSFTFTASSSTLFRIFNGDNNETRCAALSCIIGPVTITEVV